MTNNFLIKICGIKDEHSARAVLMHAPSMIGVIFIPDTPRVVNIPTAKSVQALAREAGVPVVGLFRNQPLDFVLSVLAEVPLDYVQLHGNENPEFAKHIGVPVIQRVPAGLSEQDARAFMDSYRGSVALFLFDKEKDVSGSAVDLEVVRDLSAEYPIMVAGGLTPETVAGVIEKVGKRVRGVDVSRGVERIVGEKDEELVRSFIEHSRNTYAKL